MIDPRERVLLCDFESRSRADLKTIGGRNYWEHPTSEVLVAVTYDTGLAEWGVWVPGDPPPPALAEGVLPAAHNYSGFDRFAMWRAGWFEPGCELDLAGVDTSEIARVAGLPGKLEALGTLLGFPKDKAASKFTIGLSRPSRAKKRLGLLPDITLEVFDRVLAYCTSDVEILVRGWPLLVDFLDADLPGVSAAERAVNDRGVEFDRDLARVLLEIDRRIGERVVEAELAAMGYTRTTAEARKLANTPAAFVELTGAPNAQAATVKDIIKHPERYHTDAPHWARMRQALASIARGKLRAGLLRVSPDGRLRDAGRYYGAHTGRWSHRGMQLHNIPRPAKAFEDFGEVEILALIDSAHAEWAEAA